MLDVKSLKAEMVRNGYTQEELARLLNTSRSRIGMYEQGKRQPDFEMQEAIADLFNVSIDYLFDRSSNASIVIEGIDPDLAEEALALYAQYELLPQEKRAEFLNFLKFLQSDS